MRSEDVETVRRALARDANEYQRAAFERIVEAAEQADEDYLLAERWES